jgi:hypothetical protein
MDVIASRGGGVFHFDETTLLLAVLRFKAFREWSGMVSFDIHHDGAVETQVGAERDCPGREPNLARVM